MNSLLGGFCLLQNQGLWRGSDRNFTLGINQVFDRRTDCNWGSAVCYTNLKNSRGVNWRPRHHFNGPSALYLILKEIINPFFFQMQRIKKNQNAKRKSGRKRKMKLTESKNKRKNIVKKRKKNWESRFYIQYIYIYIKFRVFYSGLRLRIIKTPFL